MPVEWATGLIKVAGPLTAKLAVAPVKSRTLSLRVAAKTRRIAKRESLPRPPYWALRKYLATGTALAAFRSESVEQYTEMSAAIGALFPGSREGAPGVEQCRALAAALLEAYSEALTPNQAIHIELRNMQRELLQHNTDEATARHTFDVRFEQSLAALPPVRARHAAELSSAWPTMKRLVYELAAAADRCQAIIDWQRQRPTWFKEPTPTVLCWLAEVAVDYGAEEAAQLLIEEAIDNGATPADYWRIRAAIITADDDADAQAAVGHHYAGQHPFADLLEAFLRQDFASAGVALSQWLPSDESEEAFRLAVQVQLSIAVGRTEDACNAAESALRTQQLTGVALTACEKLLEHGSTRQTILQFTDLERCLSMALHARDQQRKWRGPSHRAVLLAVDAAALLGNLDLAWKLTQETPDGEATHIEANNPAVSDRALLVAAQIDDPERLGALIRERSSDDPTRLKAQALIAQRSGDRDLERENWLSAYHHSTDQSDRLNTAFHLALMGHLPSDSSLAEYPEVADQLRLVNAAAKGESGLVESVVAQALTARPLTIAGVELLRARDRFIDAATLAFNAGQHWSDPGLLMTAARLYHSGKDADRVVDSCNAAMQAATPNWGGYTEARSLLFFALTAMGRWSDAAEVAAQVLAAAPANVDARWGLAKCQWRLGDSAAAWLTYSEAGDILEPRDESEALLRVALWRHGQAGSPDAIQDLRDLAHGWGHSEPVCIAIVHALLAPVDMRNPDDAEQLQALLAELIHRMPNVFTQHDVDPDDPLQALQPLVDTLPDTGEIDQKVAEGTFPLGVAATVHHRPYAEVLVGRNGSYFVTNGRSLPAELDLVHRGFGGHQVVVDTSALFSLTLLRDFAATLMGVVGPNAIATTEQRLDALWAAERLSQLSTTAIGQSPTGTPIVYSISDEEAIARSQSADSVLEWFLSMNTVDHPTIVQFSVPADNLNSFRWMVAVDHAADTGAYLWCDDARLRELANERDVPSFSTFALIEMAVRRGAISRELSKVAHSVLITCGYVGLPFDRALARDAAAIDGWEPKGSAAYVMYAAGEPTDRIEFVLEAISRTDNQPESIRGWVGAISFWLIQIVTTDDAARGNLATLVLRLLIQPWINASTVPFVLDGVRAGIAASHRDIGDPLEPALFRYFRELAETTNHAHAARYIGGLVSLGAQQDRATAARIILLNH